MINYFQHRKYERNPSSANYVKQRNGTVLGGKNESHLAKAHATNSCP